MASNDYQADRKMGHADENDGIEEYDNKLPNWWLGLFLVTIAVGLYMILDWHVFGHRTLASMYDRQMAAAEERYADLTPEPPANIVINDQTIAAGARVFQENCVSCHAEDATGRVGPNLTDNVWIHGGTAQRIADTIFNGVPEQGMPTWAPILGPERVAEVAAYVYSLGGGQPSEDEMADAPNAPNAPAEGSGR